MRSLRWAGLLALYVGAQSVGLALAEPFRSAGLSTSSNPQSTTEPIFLIAVIVLAPLFILFLARRQGGLAALRHLILLVITFALFITLTATLAVVWPAMYLLPPYPEEITIVPAYILGPAISAILYLALLMEPQWYIVDLVGFLAAGALVALLGISIGILPAFILLAALMVYDAIAVYVTKHMVSLADAVTEMKLPILMVMPDSPGFDYTRAPPLQVERTRPVEERSALFMGLGDIVFPGLLVVSAFVWLPAAPVALGVGANLWVALGAMFGSLIGYGVLMRLVGSGNPQAGLPFLNGGAFVGYILVYVLLFHSFGLGLTAAL
jgi:presenilin-like A22 family membrane protease